MQLNVFADRCHSFDLNDSIVLIKPPNIHFLGEQLKISILTSIKVTNY